MMKCSNLCKLFRVMCGIQCLVFCIFINDNNNNSNIIIFNRKEKVVREIWKQKLGMLNVCIIGLEEVGSGLGIEVFSQGYENVGIVGIILGKNDQGGKNGVGEQKIEY